MCQEVEVLAGMERDADWFVPRVAQLVGPLKLQNKTRM